MPEPLPRIFDIHRFALDDGPGIRTTVFLKGCPLSCRWCHNPESMCADPEIAWYPDKCILCGSCAAVCPEGAISESPSFKIDRSRCTVCSRCADACPATAIKVIGREYSQAELLEILLRDKHFFEASGGGVTFSGGEPTRHMEFLGQALVALKKENLQTAVQTCGLFDYDDFCRKVLPCTDLLMFDIKFIDPAMHRRYTGRDNAAILQNFSRLTKIAGDKILPRVPLVPGITATAGNLREIASFLADLGYRRCDLLPYNPAGIEKRRTLGIELPQHLPDLPLDTSKENGCRKLFMQVLHSQPSPLHHGAMPKTIPTTEKENFHADRLSSCSNLCCSSPGRFPPR